MRIGTCGSYFEDIKLFDLINAEYACSESSYASEAFGIKGNKISSQGNAFKLIKETAETMNQSLINSAIHSSDVFYRAKPGLPAIVNEHDCKVVEMEAFALFANAKHLNKSAATLLTVSDVIPTREHISADQRERSLDKMILLALESAIKM
jgi:purine-nucleoside phosphorylase